MKFYVIFFTDTNYILEELDILFFLTDNDNICIIIVLSLSVRKKNTNYIVGTKDIVRFY